MSYLKSHVLTQAILDYQLEKHGLTKADMTEQDRAKLKTVYDLAMWLGY